MNTEMKSNIAIVLSIAALGVSLFGGGGISSSAPVAGAAGYMKSIAKEAGVSGRTYDKCIAENDTTIIDKHVNETNAIAAFAELQGIGTPFNLVITDTQVIPVSGAYPYEFFNLMVTQFNETGTISQDVLDQFEITPLDYSVTEIFEAFNPDVDHYKGSATPAIAIVEYSDFECPYCSRIHTTLDQLVEENDNIAWAYRHLPLGFHAQAVPAAVASECVAASEGNEGFWSFADTLFANQGELSK